MMSLCPSSTIVKQASAQDQSLKITVVAFLLRFSIDSLENVLRSLSCFVVTHRADDVLLRIISARVLVMMLHTLPESIFEVARIFCY